MATTKRVEGVYSSTTGSPIYGETDDRADSALNSSVLDVSVASLEDAVRWMQNAEVVLQPDSPKLRVYVENGLEGLDVTTLDCRRFVGDVRKLGTKHNYNGVVDHLSALCSLILNLVDQKRTVFLRTTTSVTEVERKGLKALYGLMKTCGCDDVPRLDYFLYILKHYVTKGKSVSVLCMLAEFPHLFYSNTEARARMTSVLGCGGENIVFELQLDAVRMALRRAVTRKEFEALTKMSAVTYGGVKPFHLLSVCKHKYVAMPLMTNLESFIRDNMAQGDDGTVFVDVVEDLAQQFLVMRTLDIVHCDIKPQNIMALEVGDTAVFVAGDYGSVKKAGERCNKLGGTVPYRDPFSMITPALFEHDYWSLGISIFLLVNKLTENTNRSKTYRAIQEWNRDKATMWASGDRIHPADAARWEPAIKDMFLSKVDQDRYFSLPNAAFTVDIRKLILKLCEWTPKERMSPAKMLTWCRKMRKRHGLRQERPEISDGSF